MSCPARPLIQFARGGSAGVLRTAAGLADPVEEMTKMIDPRKFDDLARRIQASLPPGLDEVREDVTRNIRAIIAAGIARMDLVEREEFDVQSAVLARTREKLEALERRIRQLEESDSGSPAGDGRRA